MRVSIIAVGRLKSGPEKELAERYFDRFAKAGPACGLELARIIELAESRADNAAVRKREEAQQILKAAPDGAALLALDERGKAMDSGDFAHWIGSGRDAGRRDLAIVIGGADGLESDLRDRADLTLNLGRLTWPHQIVRFLIAEQLYRTVTILTGHPYHRA